MPKGYRHAQVLRRRSRNQRGGQQPQPDGLDRSPGTMAGYLNDYLEHLAVKNYADTTMHDRDHCMRYFLRWAQERDLFRPEQITKPILDSYQRYLWRYRKKNGQPLGISTQTLRLLAVKDYFAWLCRQNRLHANPASELQLPRKEKRLPEQVLTQSEVETVLAVPDVTDPLGLRDRAMLETLYSTGIRRIELIRLELTDLNRDQQTLHIRLGKGAKDRIVPLGHRARQWLDKYLEEARPLLVVDPNAPFIFLSAFGDALSPVTLSRMVTVFIKRADIGRKGSCHLLRHTCATHMLEGGADIRYIQQLLGHAKLETTSQYTEVTIQQLRLVHQQSHPAERRFADQGESQSP